METLDLKQRGTLVVLAAGGREVPKFSGPLWELLNMIEVPVPGLDGTLGIRLDGREELITGAELDRLMMDEGRNDHPRGR